MYACMHVCVCLSTVFVTVHVSVYSLPCALCLMKMYIPFMHRYIHFIIKNAQYFGNVLLCALEKV